MKKIIIYSKSYCPFCDMAKNLLTTQKLEYTVIDAEQESEKFSDLAAQHSHRTVPMIFIDDEFIGGFDSLKALHSAGGLNNNS